VHHRKLIKSISRLPTFGPMMKPMKRNIAAQLGPSSPSS
jgi:hypothetical protein